MAYKSRVLVVDDQQLMRDHMHRLLGREGYDLIYAKNGVEALEHVAASPPDLILLDVRMPEMDGFEVCRSLRENPATADIPIIMVTAFDDRDARLKGLDAGADDFIPKPYDSIELRARVRTITRLNRYRRMVSERTKFQLVAERAETGYLLVNDDLHVIFANPKARTYLGLEEAPDESNGGAFIALAQANHRLEPKEAWENWPNTSTSPSPRYLVRPETISSAAQWLRVDTIDYLLSGNEMVWMISIQDVTEQMLSRHDIWKFQRAIHHKMRTPLIGMYSGIQFLATFGDDLPPAEMKELLVTAMEHGDRLKDAVEDILRYVDSPNIASEGKRFPLGDLEAAVREVADSFNIPTLNISLPDLSADELVLSHQSMELILRELVENAKKFHPASAPTLTVTCNRQQPDQCILTLCDDGLTLTREQLAQLAVPYYQAEKSFTGEVAGMGLGLATVASLLWSVGGELEIANREDMPGICVSLTIPLAEQETAAFDLPADFDPFS